MRKENDYDDIYDCSGNRSRNNNAGRLCEQQDSDGQIIATKERKKEIRLTTLFKERKDRIMKNLVSKAEKAIKKFVHEYAKMMDIYGSNILKGYSNGLA